MSAEIIDFLANNLFTILGIASACIVGWFTMKSRVQQSEDKIKELEKDKEELKSEVEETKEAQILLQNRMSSLELQMLREFVSIASMKELEFRITTSMSELRNDISKLTEFLMKK